MADLSIEARVMFGAHWGGPMTMKVTYRRAWVIHPKARKGLDDLVTAGYLTVSKTNDGDGLTWEPTSKVKTDRPDPPIDFDFMMKHGDFPMVDESQPKPSPNATSETGK